MNRPVKSFSAGLALRAGVAAVVVGSVTAIPLPVAEYSAHAARFKDECKDLRKPFSSIKNKRAKASIIGGVAGALLGGLLGATQKTQKVVTDENGNQRVVTENKALEGALIGGLLGAGLGYLSKLEESREDKEVLAKVLEGHRDDRAQYSNLPQQLIALGNCRVDQYYSIKDDFEKGVIDQREAEKRLKKVDDWVEDDDKTISKAAGKENESVIAFAQSQGVIEGKSAQEVDAEGEDILDRYEAEAEKYESTVLLDFEGEEFEIDEVEDISVQTDEPTPLESVLPQFVEGFVKSKRGANMRAEPNQESEIVTSVGYRAKIMVAKSDVEGWSAVTYKTDSGFMADFLISSERPPELVRKNTKSKRSVPSDKRAKAKLRNSGQSGSGVAGAVATSNNFANANRARSQVIDRAQADATRAILGGLST